MSNKNGWITDRVPDSNRVVVVNFGGYVGIGKWFAKCKRWKYETMEHDEFVWEWRHQGVLGWQERAQPEKSEPVDWKEIAKN